MTFTRKRDTFILLAKKDSSGGVIGQGWAVILDEENKIAIMAAPCGDPKESKVVPIESAASQPKSRHHESYRSREYCDQTLRSSTKPA